jgi:hypothetical protein
VVAVRYDRSAAISSGEMSLTSKGLPQPFGEKLIDFE